MSTVDIGVLRQRLLEAQEMTRDIRTVQPGRKQKRGPRRRKLGLSYYLLPNDVKTPPVFSGTDDATIQSHHQCHFGFPGGSKTVKHSCQLDLTVEEYQTFLRSLYPHLATGTTFRMFTKTRKKSLEEQTIDLDKLWHYSGVMFLKINDDSDQWDDDELNLQLPLSTHSSPNDHVRLADLVSTPTGPRPVRPTRIRHVARLPTLANDLLQETENVQNLPLPTATVTHSPTEQNTDMQPQAARLPYIEHSLPDLRAEIIQTEVWRKMTSNRILPETRDYNLLLRAVNTCGVGDQQLFSKMLMDSSAGLTNNYQSLAQPPDQKYLSGFVKQTVARYSICTATVRRYQRPLDVAPRIFSDKAVPARKESRVFMQTDTHRSNTTAVSPSRTPHCEGDHVDNHRNNKNRAAPLMQKSGTMQDKWWQTDHKTSRPGVVVRFKPSAEQTHSSESTVDIMNLAAPMSKIISVSNIKTASDKLWLLGGANKLMAQMARDGAKPDIVTFIMLMLAVPAEEEADILDMMSTYKVDPETSLFNHLIHKRAASQRPLEALAARKMMDDYGLKPNMKTFGCLAMICKKPDRGFTLVKEMQDMDLEPNLVIMTTLVYQSTLDFQYKAKLLQTMDRFNLPTTEKMIFHIENHISLAKEILLKQEKGEELDGMHAVMAKKLTAETLESFVTFYDEWIKTKSMEEKEHPWKHFIKNKPRENTDKKD